MTELNDREAVLRRIKAMLNSNGRSEAEAMMFAAKAAQLMAEYRFTQSDLEFEEEPIGQHSVDRRQAQKVVTEDFCIPGIQRLCGVKCWFQGGGRSPRKLVIFGKRADCDHAEWLYKMIGSAIMAEAEIYKRQTAGETGSMAERRAAVLSFRRGMTLRINERLKEMADELDPTMTLASGKALVPVRNAAVMAAFNQLGIKFGAGVKGARARMGGDAYTRGRDAGEKVALRRPVGSSSPVKGYIN